MVNANLAVNRKKRESEKQTAIFYLIIDAFCPFMCLSLLTGPKAILFNMYIIKWIVKIVDVDLSIKYTT